MAKLKREAKRSKDSVRLRGFRKWTVLAAALAIPLFGCSNQQPETHKPPGMRCYTYEDKELHVYVENKAKDKKGELGKEYSLDAAELDVSDQNPLTFFCTRSGHLFWVTKENVHIRKLSLEEGQLKSSKVLDTRHVDPDEFQIPGVKVVSADVWRNPHEVWQNISVVTLTNTGLFNVARYSLEAAAKNKLDRGVYDLANKLKPGNSWPKEGVASGSVRALEGNKFVAIPIGEKGKGNVSQYYFISVDSKPGEQLTSGKVRVRSLRPWSADSGYKNIIKISAPIRFDRSLGGWIVNLLVEKENGETEPIFPIVTPE